MFLTLTSYQVTSKKVRTETFRGIGSSTRANCVFTPLTICFYILLRKNKGDPPEILSFVFRTVLFDYYCTIYFFNN